MILQVGQPYFALWRDQQFALSGRLCGGIVGTERAQHHGQVGPHHAADVPFVEEEDDVVQLHLFAALVEDEVQGFHAKLVDQCARAGGLRFAQDAQSGQLVPPKTDFGAEAARLARRQAGAQVRRCLSGGCCGKGKGEEEANES